MSDINAILTKATIQKVSVEISNDIGDSFELKADCRAKILPPKEKDNTLLVNLEIQLLTPDEKWIDIFMAGDVIFSFDYQPEEDDKEVGKAIINLALALFFEKVDNTLEEMGHSRLGLKENFKV